LNDALARTRRVRAAADLLIATAFEANPENLAQQVAMGLDQQEAAARAVLADKRPFHWPVEFPEVFVHREGFDAIIGNPPFIGGKRISGVVGKEYREYLVTHLANAVRGNADYVAYFFLRAFELLKPGGGAGLVATNSIAQGDTCEVGLDQLAARGAVIYRAVASRKWPGDASLEVAWVWWCKGAWRGDFVLEEKSANGITTHLTRPGEVGGIPHRLGANAGKSFQGSIVLGMGFVLKPEEAQRLLDKDPRNGDVLCPYLNGEDLNNRWDQSPSRWVINFRDWPVQVARQYPDCFDIVERLIKAERLKGAADVAAAPWWQFWRPRAELYGTISGLERVLVISRVSHNHFLHSVVPRIVFSERLVVFALSGNSPFGLLSSTIHNDWAHRPGATTHETRNTYFHEKAFETFAFPQHLGSLEEIGERYRIHREGVMADRHQGLSEIYNSFHCQTETADGVRQLRTLHVEMDHAVAASYGWTDLDLGHGLRETNQGTRFTISESARREVLDRLLALNHARHTEEVASAPPAKQKRVGKKKSTSQNTLF